MSTENHRMKYFSSGINLDETMDKYGLGHASASEYHPVMVEDPLYKSAYVAIFTEKEIDRAMNRGLKFSDTFRDMRYRPCEPDLVADHVAHTISGMPLGLLFKLWIMRMMGIDTHPVISEICYGKASEEGASEERSPDS